MKDLVFFTLLCGLLASCSNQSTKRILADSLGGATGALMAHQASGGKAGWTAAGAAGGVLLSEGVQHLGNKQSKKAYEDGYDQGRSDAVRQQYWMMVDEQSAHLETENFSFYQFPVPEHDAAGTTMLPSLRTLRIHE